jgi:hypothetical protein
MDECRGNPSLPENRSENLLYRNPLHLTRAGLFAPGPVFKNSN